MFLCQNCLSASIVHNLRPWQVMASSALSGRCLQIQSPWSSHLFECSIEWFTHKSTFYLNPLSNNGAWIQLTIVQIIAKSLIAFAFTISIVFYHFSVWRQRHWQVQLIQTNERINENIHSFGYAHYTDVPIKMVLSIYMNGAPFGYNRLDKLR